MIPAPITVFNASYTLYGAGDWSAITVPDWCSFLNVDIYGAGGNGGNGHSDIAGAVRGGGGGGGNGARASIFIPIYGNIQRVFYANLAAAGSGAVSYLSLLPETTHGWLLLTCNPGGNGGNSSGSAGGSVGAAAAVSTNAAALFHSLGLTSYRAGTAGNAGATTNSSGGNMTWGNNGLYTCQGPGGGGVTATDRSGGGVVGSGATPTIPLTAAATAGVPGIYNLDGPLPYSLPGNGGGSSNTTPGGAGGAGAPGSGGGGGGGGTTGGVGGTGGRAFAVVSMG